MLSKRSLSTALLLMLCLSACTTTTPQAQPDKAPPQAATDTKCVAPTPDPSLPACEAEDDTCRVERMGSTQVGWLAQGLSLEAVKARLGEPDSVTEPQEEGATGDIFQVFVWKKAGVEVDGRAGDEQGTLVVYSFTVEAPFVGQTVRCVGLGSSRAQVVEAYGDFRDPNTSESERSFIAGSIYGGMFFYFDDQGKVSSIFVGPGAE